MKLYKLILLAVLLITVAGCENRDSHANKHVHRQAEVAAKGSVVMPFSLTQTTHIFNKNDTGGLQKVVANHPEDDEQINLIRQHLSDEAKRFAVGDFTDPAKIHGANMPGLLELQNHDGKIDIQYSDIKNGGQIIYTTTNAKLLAAIHHWFDAQLTDHGDHAKTH